MIQRAAIIGDGAMGTVSAMLLSANGARTSLWSAFQEHADEMGRTGENKRFLPGFPLPEGLRISTDAAEATEGADLIVIAVPSRHLRGVLGRIKAALPERAVYVSVVKGIEAASLLRPSEVIREVAGERRLAVLSGPCLAREIAARLPATAVVASSDAETAQIARDAFATPYFRVYTSADH
ncbi:MAG TPA: NAD(P)-binding domain-containing protein, partial [Phycisphaerae bacterium]|nr:NAD(P)-binding domain-containing protein [Phycisphaerae bacterium]